MPHASDLNCDGSKLNLMTIIKAQLWSVSESDHISTTLGLKSFFIYNYCIWSPMAPSRNQGVYHHNLSESNQSLMTKKTTKPFIRVFGHSWKFRSGGVSVPVHIFHVHQCEKINVSYQSLEFFFEIWILHVYSTDIPLGGLRDSKVILWVWWESKGSNWPYHRVI